MTNWEWLEALANNSPDELQAWFDSEHVENANATSHGDTAALDAKSSDDSREKLEADAGELTADYAASGEVCDALHGGIIALLDRQAAITEEQTRYKWVTASADEIAAWRSKAEKLKAQVYELTAERDKLQEQLLIGWECECRLQAERDELKAEHERIVQELVDANTRQCERTNELTAERDKFKELNEYHALQYELASEDCDRLQAQVDTLKSRHCPHYDANEHTCDVHETRIAELTAEREQYRKLFGMALDWAHEITMLESSVDEGMA